MFVQWLIAKALGNLGDMRTFTALLETLENDNLEVGAEASEALTKLRG